MLFTKEIEKITYQDVVDFCSQKYKESIHLDYKQNINKGLVKTIAAMTNTWGGLIVIGVEDEDSKPKIPAIGLPYKEHLREQINNLILGNITPPLFPEIQVCPSEDGKTAFIIVRVPQSNLTPHGIKNNTKVYIRTDTSNEPEELATIDRISWLVEKRERSTELKNNFFKKADERFNILCKKAGAVIKYADTIFAMSPLYPFKTLIDYKKLRQEIPSKISVRGWGYSFPIYMMEHSEFHPTQDGAYGFFFNDHSGYILYEELNHYGFFYHRENLCHTRKNEKSKPLHHTFLWDILRRTDMFFDTMTKLYTELGYWGLLELKISLNKLGSVDFQDLPAPRGYRKFDNITSSPIDHRLEFTKIISYQELKENRIPLVIDLVKEISWSIGFSHIKAETIEKLMQENGRI